MINVVNVTHHYGVRPVLRHVNLLVPRGEVVALMGPNGSGKSTLMSIMAGMLAPVRGHVEIDGRIRRSSPENELAIRRQVVYSPAEPWAPAARTGLQWVLAAGRVYGVDDERLMDHAPQLLSLFNLETKADEPISSYSTGQRKKLALAAALASEAPVMLMDEPFAGGLDPSGIHALKSLFLHHRQKRDATIVIATPVPELVEEVADRVAILRDGRVLAYDTIDALRARSGGVGRLDRIYEELASPDTSRNIDKYFKEMKA